MGGQRKWRRSIENSLTHKGRATFALDVLEEMRENLIATARIANDAHRQTLVLGAMYGELLREFHSMGIIDLTDTKKFPRTYKELFGAQANTDSESESSTEGESTVEDNAETTEIHSGNGGGPEQRDSSSPESGVQQQVSESIGIEDARGRENPGGTSETLRRLPEDDLGDSGRQPKENSEISKRGQQSRGSKSGDRSIPLREIGSGSVGTKGYPTK